MQEETERLTYFYSYHGYTNDGMLKYYGDGTVSTSKEESYAEIRKAIIDDIEKNLSSNIKVHIIAFNSIKI